MNYQSYNWDISVAVFDSVEFPKTKFYSYIDDDRIHYIGEEKKDYSQRKHTHTQTHSDAHCVLN